MRRLLLLLLLVAMALAILAPAWLLGRGIRERSGGLVELRSASGTIWSGAGDVFMRGRTVTDSATALGRIAWRVERIDWAQRALTIAVRQTPASPRPAIITLGADRTGIAGSALLPAAIAGRVPLLAGWTIAGTVVVDSDTLEWTDGAGTGAATALWRNATLVPPDLPGGFALGEVTARIALDGAAVVVSVRNSGGDIELTGDASSRTRTLALLLQPRAGATGAQIAWLQSHTMARTPRGYTIDAGWPGR